MEERCPACGNTLDFCEGHYGKPWRIILAHYRGKHDACSVRGCDYAFDRWIEETMKAEPTMAVAS
jgi:hypothetical protein